MPDFGAIVPGSGAMALPRKYYFQFATNSHAAAFPIKEAGRQSVRN
jgi:hypothetical protein